mmetsp:Transcript_17178/g.40093  ORF Transcript_17178/g.40093 Transcript_17178/m.40093 type:complete len:223 (+) Transcript_17178:567-1235(+)
MGLIHQNLHPHPGAWRRRGAAGDAGPSATQPPFRGDGAHRELRHPTPGRALGLRGGALLRAGVAGGAGAAARGLGSAFQALGARPSDSRAAPDSARAEGAGHHGACAKSECRRAARREEGRPGAARAAGSGAGTRGVRCWVSTRPRTERRQERGCAAGHCILGTISPRRDGRSGPCVRAGNFGGSCARMRTNCFPRPSGCSRCRGRMPLVLARSPLPRAMRA